MESPKSYPYFVLPALLALKEGKPSPLTAELVRRVAITLGSRAAVDRVLDRQASLFDNFYPQEHKSTPATNDAIDTFLATFGRADDRETDALEKMIFNPTPDYGAVLAAEEKGSFPSQADLDNPELSEHDWLINSFIAGTYAPAEPKEAATAAAQPTVAEPEPVAVEQQSKSDKLTNEAKPSENHAKEADSASLTESFVRILIKNRNYSKAIEIISDLSLKNPEKSIYFADQIRFLRKLIINENNK